MLQKIKKIDGVIVVVLLMLMVISIFSIYSVTHGRDGLDGMHMKMIRFYVLGLVAFLGLTFLDYRLIIKYALYIYITGIGILVLVSFIGKTQNGAQGWLSIGGLSLQPAELFKLILILFLAAVLVRKNKNKLLFWKDIVPLTLLTLLPFVIVISQNDLGNALSYIVILAGLLWIGNIKFSHALIAVAIVIGGAIAGIMSYIHYHDELKTFMTDIGRSHWVERFDPWLVPEKATAKASYHTKNAKLAIASGGMSGEGYMNGSSVQTDRVPYTYSDSIFVQIAEEFGFVGSALLLLLYFILIHRMILIALESKDRGGPFLIVGIVAMILYQVFENIGAFIGLMPLTGITLPFISFGGTSLMINMASIGLAMSVRLHGQEVEEDLPAPAAYPAAAKQG
ncbi:cell cycle protein [Paenibacillus sp. FSL R7-0273]|uniref:FtsW/RodA/SpoVE family cell cycle protein n=1 Tax=Paenibacillus sp. FSL R7-0273 TaxID=1536772 RepID=UPI0004F5EF9B|nr:FtsW/RodA/SpoVE family cell cycle protein [Paenibacillus sp. FSL R7-0273]AIQ49763.1 cell cycle protein [Paenibacillus sp. FSL R7-0273]OMF92345.1 cell cycle protein [Paenibacillus sp. FSL R7-0273]